MSEDENEEIVEELPYWAVNAALLIDLEKLATTDSQQMDALNEGDTAKGIRNLVHNVNRMYSIVKHNPIKIKGGNKKSILINTDQLNEFNDLVDDYFFLTDLLEQIFNTRYGSISTVRAKEYYAVFVPKYEKQVDELAMKETKKPWKDHEHSDLYLRKFMLKKINKLGYDLQGQCALAIVQTLPVDFIEQLQNSLNQGKGYE